MDINSFNPWQHPDGSGHRIEQTFDSAFGKPVHVDGHFREDGTYVKPHFRSMPNGNPFDNWSYPGNMNPFTGEVASGDMAAYLAHHSSFGAEHVLQHANPLDYIHEYRMPPLHF